MSRLICKDVIQRIGYTVIDGVQVVQYNCVIDVSKPQAMRITTSKLDDKLYKANREACRADLATFEDSAYELQEQYIAQVNARKESAAEAND